MEKRFVRSALFATGGLLIWAADFLFVYVFAALACERGFAHAVPWVSSVTAVVAAAACVVMLVAGLQAKSFIGRLAANVAGLALLAIAFIALPGVLLPRAC